MICENCGSQIEEGTRCRHCGYDINDPSTQHVINNNTETPTQDAVDCNEETPIQGTTANNVETPIQNVDIKKEGDNSGKAEKYNFSSKAKKTINKVISGALIVGAVGAFIFLIIVLAGLIGWGKVYLFDPAGYDSTRVFAGISLALMMIGICGIIAKTIFVLVFKVGRFPTTTIKKVLLTYLVVVCVAFSIWGYVDCGIHQEKKTTSTFVDFYSIYYDCGCTPLTPWAEVDVYHLSIDTNPYDYDSDSSNSKTYLSAALSAIRMINTKLGFPAYVYQDMIETRAIDGKQSYSNSRATATWRYHPDSGLEVRYTN